VYIAEQEDKQQIHPAMVIQVEDGDKNRLTKTDLEQVLKTLEQEVGTISDDDLAHSFQEDQTFTVGHHKIRKIEASRIQEETSIKFIFFKMALTTGWDCPRAEVMMSFRRAQDHTLIAQLIGRMIRTPLARRIEGRELLNTVSLYLPHYDKEGVNQVVTRLKSDPDYVPPIDVEEGATLVTFRKDETCKEAIDELSGLPTYRVDKIRKASNTRRLMRLSRLLTMLHEIDLDAWDDSKKMIVATLDAEKERLIRDDPDFDKKVAECTEIKVNAVTIEQGTWRELGGSSITVRRDDHNIDDLFNRAGQKLGEGLHIDYWQAHYDEEEPTRPKLELVFILQSQQAWDTLEKECGKRIEHLFSKHRAAIRGLTTSEHEKYNKVKEIAKDPEALDMLPPAEIMVAVDKNGNEFNQFGKHLYVDEQGKYWAKLNTWETAAIEAEIARDDVIGWLRNYDRKQWALSMPYEIGGSVSAMYPDFLVVRKDEDGYLVDILEPHSSSLADSYAKAQGLAKYAKKHHDSFGRIELIRVDGGKITRIDLNDTATRNNVLLVDSNQALDLIFNQVNG
jgi:type III restriction enzyme